MVYTSYHREPSVAQALGHTITSGARTIKKLVSDVVSPRKPKIKSMVQEDLFTSRGSLRSGIVRSSKDLPVVCEPIIPSWSRESHLEVVFSDPRYAIGRITGTSFDLSKYVLIEHMDGMGSEPYQIDPDVHPKIYALVSPHFAMTGARGLTAVQHVQAFNKLADFITKQYEAVDRRECSDVRIFINTDFELNLLHARCMLNLPKNSDLDKLVREFFHITESMTQETVNNKTQALIKRLKQESVGAQGILYDYIVREISYVHNGKDLAERIESIKIQLLALYNNYSSDVAMTENTYNFLEKRMHGSSACYRAARRNVRLGDNDRSSDSKTFTEKNNKNEMHKLMIKKLHLIELKSMPTCSKGYDALATQVRIYHANCPPSIVNGQVLNSHTPPIAISEF